MNVRHFCYFLTGLVFILSSCLREEENLFSESAALRLNHAIENTKKALISPKHNNGWIMEYFPTNNQEGYTFLMKFDNNSFATIAAKNKYTPVYTTDKGAFDVIGDNGPVLTFNTYNKVFHLFSDPKDPLGSSSLNGIGLGGDYEFVIMDVTDDLITLKGKKRGTHVLMRPVKQGQDWQGYFNELDDLKGELFDNKVTLQLNKDGENLFELYNSTTGIFEKLQIGGDITKDSENLPFIITDYGIRLSQPFEIEKETRIQIFNLNKERNKLVAKENDSYIITAPQPGEFLQSDNSTFLAEKSETTGMDELFSRVAAGMTSAFNSNYELVKIGFGKKDKRPALVLFTKNGIIAMFNIPMAFEGNRVNIAKFDADSMTNNDMDNNARLFYERVPVIKELLNFIQGDYIVATSTPFTLRVLKYTKTNGSLVLNVSR